MKNIDTDLIGKILIIIGLFLAHPLLGIFIIGILLLIFGGILIP